MRKAALVVALFSTSVMFAAQDPAAALMDAKTHLTAKRYAEATEAARAGLEAAATIGDENQRKQALTALNFYAAAGASGAGDADAARVYLEEFLRLSPSTRRIDPAKYDAKFVALFDTLATPTDEADMFAALYPRYSASYAAPDANAQALTDAAAIELLGTKVEKREWRDVATSAKREEFLRAFWAKRDASPETPRNEFREQFTRRVAFADAAFATNVDRGALTDRGKVFVLLGRPGFVRRRPITPGDKVYITGLDVNKVINGTMEHWVYSSQQLPVAYSKPSVRFRFVTQEGIGNNVLLKDNAFAMNALGEAANIKRK